MVFYNTIGERGEELLRSWEQTTNLTNANFLVKTSKKRREVWGKVNHCWKLQGENIQPIEKGRNKEMAKKKVVKKKLKEKKVSKKKAKAVAPEFPPAQDLMDTLDEVFEELTDEFDRFYKENVKRAAAALRKKLQTIAQTCKWMRKVVQADKNALKAAPKQAPSKKKRVKR